MHAADRPARSEVLIRKKKKGEREQEQKSAYKTLVGKNNNSTKSVCESVGKSFVKSGTRVREKVST